jgi:D-xylonolactonase
MVLIKIEDQNALPDGLTVDSKEHIWNGEWNGSCIKRYGSEGKLMQKITSLAFGGKNF